MALSITWLGQSGLLLRGGGQTVVVDPWLSPHANRATPPPIVDWPEVIDLVLITHGHGDHLDLPGLTDLSTRTHVREIAAPAPHLRRIAAALPNVSRLSVQPDATLDRLGGIATLPAWHGVKASDGYGPMLAPDGTSPHVGYLFALGGLRIYVSGDTLADPALIDTVRPLRAEIAFLPVNGRDAEREARGILGNMSGPEAVDFATAIGARILVPLHHDGVTGNTADVGEVVRAARGKPLHVIVPARSIPLVLDGTSP